MKRTILKACSAASTAILAVTSIAAAQDTADFTASALILEAITVTKSTDLDFASIAPDASTAATVEVTPAGARNCGAILTCSGTVSAASFSVTGADGATFAVTLPAAANITSGADTMLVDTFTSSLTGNTGTLTGGAATFSLGATLNVGAAQPAGSYTGTFTVTVDYN
ncbi:DUF4402 domain-containing protein [Parvularcula mediterranea]|uniref:DUF4402 domain-containing protein n=1 Tax=Parvularcula mediterranea TaxID=2732508 RepID=UPI0018E9AAC4